MRYFLVAAEDDEGQAAFDALTDLTESTTIISGFTEHDNGCCCKNCPWEGNHG